MKLTLVSLVLMALSGAASASPTMQMIAGCIDVSKDHAQVRLIGKLSLHNFPGPPNYESVAHGDQLERVFLLALDHSICLFDGNQFADPLVRFRTAHISFEDVAVRARLRKFVGKRVAVGGDGFAAFDAHHRAPLVVFAHTIQAR